MQDASNRLAAAVKQLITAVAPTGTLDLADAVGDAAQAFAGLVGDLHSLLAVALALGHGGDRLAGADLQFLDHLLDFLRRLLVTVGEVAHLAGHHGEAATVFPDAGGVAALVLGSS